MSNIAISYGTYYSYLRPKIQWQDTNTIEPEIQIFADGEIAVEFPHSVRDKKLFIFGDTVHHLTELLMTVNAARRSSAKEINVVLPYYGYSRQDKRGKTRSSMGAEVMATVLQALGVNRIIAIDLHADQIQLAFNQAVVEHISGKHLFYEMTKEIIDGNIENEVIFASPDAGGTVRVKEIATMFAKGYVIIDKKREKANEVATMMLLGDVKDKIVILRDDMVDTGGTLVKAVDYLIKEGAKKVYVLITHPIFSGEAIRKITDAKVNLIVVNTRNTVVNLENEYIKVLDCYPLLSQVIFDVARGVSITENYR